MSEPKAFTDEWYHDWYLDVELSGPGEGVDILKKFEQAIRADERTRRAAAARQGEDQ